MHAATKDGRVSEVRKANDLAAGSSYVPRNEAPGGKHEALPYGGVQGGSLVEGDIA